MRMVFRMPFDIERTMPKNAYHVAMACSLLINRILGLMYVPRANIYKIDVLFWVALVCTLQKPWQPHDPTHRLMRL